MKTFFVFTLVFLFFSVLAQAQYPNEPLWIETGRPIYQTSERVALCVSWGDATGLKEFSLYVIGDPDGIKKNPLLKESKTVPGGTGYQVYFIFLEEQTGNYIYVASVTNMKNEVFWSNELTLTFTYPVGNPSIGEKKYEPNGWFRVWGDYNNDGTQEWSQAFLTASLDKRERDMNADGAINILDEVLYNKWLQGKYNPNLSDPVLKAPQSPALNKKLGVTAIAWAKIKTG